MGFILRGREGVGESRLFVTGASIAIVMYLVATSLLALLLVAPVLRGSSLLLAASARLPFVVGLDSCLPAAFGRLRPRFRTPYVSLAALAAVTVFFVVLSGLGEKAGQVYQILISLETVTFLLPYLYSFAAVVKFEVDMTFRGRVHLPRGRKNAMAVGIVGSMVVAAPLVLALVPGDDVENHLTFYLTIMGSLTFNMTAGIGLYLYDKRKRG